MKKILLFGPEVSDFLNPLAKKLIDFGYTVDILENRKIPRNNNSITESYSTVLNYHQIVGNRINFADIIRYLFTKELINNYYKELFINCLEGKCNIFKNLKNCLNRQLLNERFSTILNNYDIIHFHSLSPGTLSFVKYINPNKKIILSFWGADLYYIHGLKNYYEQLEAIKRADIITVMSHEMELMVLAKFGREMKRKIVRILFGIRDEVFDLMDETKKSRPDLNFLEKYNIPKNKIKITIGYNGNLTLNHLLILDEIEKIEPKTKEKIHLLVPMTYGNFSQDYMDEVKLKLNRTKITFTIFDKFLPSEEVSKLRVNSNIMIKMSRSDALCASVSEYLYADNLLISAIWLPYSPYRSEKIFFYETDFQRLCETVTYAAENYEKIKSDLVNNPDKVKRLTGFSQNWQRWITLLNSLN